MAITLDLIIGAKNLAGGAFSSLQSQLNKTTGVVGNFRNKLGDIKNALAENRAAQKAVSTEGITGFEGLNTGLLAVAGTIGLITLAYSKMQSAASSALDAQFDRVTDISTLQQTLGTSVEESAKLADLSRKKIAQFGVDLPISVGDVRLANSLILDDYAAALKGKLSNEQIVSATTSDAARLGVLRGSLTSSGQAAFSSNIAALLSGSTGAGGINQLAIAQNIQFKNAYLAELKKRGVDNLGKLDPGSKIQAFSAILEASITDSQIKLLQGTGKAALSSISDKLFDPDVGIFSFARNLAGEGQERRTVIDEFTKTLDLLFGDKGLFAQVGRLGFLGKGDPIEPIYQAVRGLNNYLDVVNANLAKLKSLSPALAGGIIGKGAADLTNAILDGIIGAVGSIDWGGVLIGVGAGIASFLTNLDWKVYAVGAVALIGAALIPPLLAAVGGFAVALGAAIVSVVGAPVLLIGGAIVLGVIAITKLIGDNLGGIRGVIAGAGNAIKNGYNSVVAGIGSLLSTGKSFLIGSLEFLFGKEGLKQITGGLASAWEITKAGFSIVRDYVGAFISGSIKGVGDFFSELGVAFGQIFNAVGEAIAGVVNAVKSLISSVVQPIQSSINGLSGSVSGYVSSVQNTGGLLAPQNALPVIGAAINPLGAATNFVVDKVAGFFGARAQGQNMGLLDAIDAENASKPSGSSLVVANSSELIVPRDKIPQIRKGVTFGNINLTVNLPSGTPNEIATEVLSLLGDRLQAEIDAIIA